MNNKILNNSIILLSVTCILSCNNSTTTESSSTDSTKTDSTNKMTTSNETAVNLFDGKSLSGWHGYNKTGEVKNWQIEDGALVCLGAAEGDTGGDLVSDKEYGNFEFSWDWT